jgi:hypothetical protein
MLVVKLELHSAVTGQTTEIGRCVIMHDDDVSNPDIGNYDVVVNSNAYSTNGALQRTGKVKDYPRRTLNVWRLVLRALKSAFPEES